MGKATSVQPREQVPLAERTSLGIGGPARHFVEVDSEPQLQRALAWADGRGVAVEVLGGGSNVVIADRGIDALVLRMTADSIAATTRGECVHVAVGAGLAWDELVVWAVSRGYPGLACLSGIPGDVGAAPIQNIGAYGQEVGALVERVVAIERRGGKERTFGAHDCEFAYRDSIFKKAEAGRLVIVRVEFKLPLSGPPAVRYPALQQALSHLAGDPSLVQLRQAVMALRRDKSMLLDQDDENGRSAGSFFVNPIVSLAELEHVRAAAAQRCPGEELVRYPAGDSVKLSAAWLIERAGMVRGMVRGRVGISTRHCLALVNRGGGTAAELVALAAEVRSRVHDAFGVLLDPEPRFLGFEPSELAPLFEA